MPVILDFEKPIFDLEAQIADMKSAHANVDITPEIEALQNKLEAMRKEIYANLTPWQKVQLARHPERPRSLDYIERISDGFMELHGDRLFGDDHAIVSGIGRIDGKEVMIIGQQKGKDTKSHVYRNFGMPNPEGYRKAMRLMHMAAKFKRPILTLIDTPGAYPGAEAEQRGQGEAIARNLFEMASLKVPVLCIVIGEGASGGALGIGVGDRLLMLENTWYSVISPEACSSILWRTAEHKEKAALALKPTPQELLELKIIDGIVKEPLGGAHANPAEMAQTLKQTILHHVDDLEKLSSDERIKRRIQKYSAIGEFKEL